MIQTVPPGFSALNALSPPKVLETTAAVRIGGMRQPYDSDGVLIYKPLMCPVIGACLDGDKCEFCHSRDELEGHPMKRRQIRRAVTSQFRESVHLGDDLKPRDLELGVFKVAACGETQPHNPKLCPNYHSSKDRRRPTLHSTELCADAETDMCKLKDRCTKAHNRVEQLYHSTKFRVKFCSNYPSTISLCEYGRYCSFAHSEAEIKVDLIHSLKRTADFYMTTYKTVWCPFNSFHEKANCVYAHNWQDYRRPLTAGYESAPCPNWKTVNCLGSCEEGGCAEGMQCPMSHGWKELEFHPLVYKTKACQTADCDKQDCPHYHGADRRLATPSLHRTASCPSSSLMYQRAMERRLSADAAPFDTGRLKRIDLKVQSFLARHGLGKLSDRLCYTSWSQLSNVQLDSEDQKLLSEALAEEQAELVLADELILEDIAIFTGHLPHSNKSLKEFSLPQDHDELVIVFPRHNAIAAELCCPLTKRIMHDPVISPLDGKTYERLAITELFREQFDERRAADLARTLRKDEHKRAMLVEATKDWA